MAYGVTLAGFVSKPLLVIKEELEAAWRAEFGANADLDPNTPDGQVIGIMADREAALWELAQAVYSGFDPDKNSGASQDAVAAITGSVRRQATAASVTLTATGSDGTLLTTGREVSDGVSTERFATSANATLSPASLRANTTAYTVGQYVRTTTPQVFICITAGTSGSSAPVGPGDDITDGTVHWRYVGEGLAYANVAAEAVDAGALTALSGSLTTIETPVSGWENVTNLLDAVPGENVADDDEFRVAREAELAAAGGGTPPAIAAAVLKVDGVTSCVVFKNDTSAVDGDGRPAHSVEAVVEGGTNADVAAAVFANVSAGIEPYGTTVVSVTDSQSLSWDVGFSRPDELELWVRVDVIKNPLTFPVDGSDQIIAAIVGDEPNYPIGKNAVASRITARCFDVDGVLDVSLTYIGLANPPVASTTVPAGPRERIALDTSRITVNLTDGVP